MGAEVLEEEVQLGDGGGASAQPPHQRRRHVAGNGAAVDRQLDAHGPSVPAVVVSGAGDDARGLQSGEQVRHPARRQTGREADVAGPASARPLARPAVTRIAASPASAGW